MSLQKKILDLIPLEEKSRIIKRKYFKNEFLNIEPTSALLLIISGEAYILRYENGKEVYYPYIISGEFLLGTRYYISKTPIDWDVVVYSDELFALEIPIDILECYVFSNLDCYNYILNGIFEGIRQGTRGFYIRAQGGVYAYLAYIFWLMSKTNKIISLKSYIELSKIVFSNKTMLYKATNKLVENRIIEKDQRTITILDREKLRKIFEEYTYEG